jgi:hypothetical protein
MYIVTLKLAKNPAHNPRAKQTGLCPVNGEFCTDTTGEHHTILMDAPSAEDVFEHFNKRGIHVTRIEAAQKP